MFQNIIIALIYLLHYMWNWSSKYEEPLKLFLQASELPSLRRIPQLDFHVFFVVILLNRLRHHGILKSILHKHFLLSVVGRVPGAQLKEAMLLVEQDLKQNRDTVTTATPLNAAHSKVQGNSGTKTSARVTYQVNCGSRFVLGF